MEDMPFLHVLYISCKGHMTFCGIFHKVKDMPTGPINFLLRDMPRVIPQVLEYRECEMYIMISFCRTCHDRASSVPHEVHLSSLLAGVR